jgi:hypothetical protein
LQRLQESEKAGKEFKRSILKEIEEMKNWVEASQGASVHFEENSEDEEEEENGAIVNIQIGGISPKIAKALKAVKASVRGKARESRERMKRMRERVEQLESEVKKM